MTHDQMIEVIQAHKDGKAIEMRYVGDGEEWETCRSPVWNFSKWEYRIKPAEPRTLYAVFDRQGALESISSNREYIEGVAKNGDRAVATFVEQVG